ncbi:MAG TPA: tetratricopeptide repeat protein [Methylophilus sp.]|nr:tetratricopeptide repeat protein [Methylophilus sp.]
MKYISLITMLYCLGGCSNMPSQASDTGQPSNLATDRTLQSKRMAVVEALKNGQLDQAKKLAEELVLADPKSANAHLLLALTYHSLGDAESLNMASSGYNASRQFAGQDMWPHYLAGVVAMQQQNAQQALEYFSTAALAEPDNTYVFEGLAAAAYASGRLNLAEHAAKRALSLQPDSVIAWRMLALALAAQGNRNQLNALLSQKPELASEEQQHWLKVRTQNLLRTTSVDEYQKVALAEEEEQEARPAKRRIPIKPLAAQQLTVDVTLILSDKKNTSRTGVNLLDGLQAVFGYDRTITSTKFRETGFLENNTSNRTITRGIGIPDVTYNLNIFNRGDRFYDAIARPSLTAFVGETSRFFIGDQLNVNVAGIQSAQIEKINVGVSMKIVPSQITEDGARFQLEVDRSFLSDTNAGTFTQAVGTFKQTVSATADIKFGETLILSGLSESVGDNTESRTPVVGDIPLIKTLFSNKTTLKRARSAIILVTPSLPSSIARTVNNLPATTKLLELWDKVIEPSVGSEKLIHDISNLPQFSRFAYGDAQVRGPEDEALKKVLLESLKNHASI